MTVAAVILAASPASALADADGTPAARRLADVAWAGGATPVVVCSFDPDGTVAASLANAEVTLADPVAAGGRSRGPDRQRHRGRDAPGDRHATPRSSGLRASPGSTRRPSPRSSPPTARTGRPSCGRPTAGEPGFPVLLPVAHLDAFRGLAVDRMPGDLFADLVGLGVPLRIVDTGDPGVVLDVSVPRGDLPAFDGPPEPADDARSGDAAVADQPDDAPVAGPNRLEPAP